MHPAELFFTYFVVCLIGIPTSWSLKITTDSEAKSIYFPGDNLTLTCQSEGAKSYNWTRSLVYGSPAWSSSLPVYQQKNGAPVSEIVFAPIRPADGGTYNCGDDKGGKDHFALNVASEDSLIGEPMMANNSVEALLKCHQRFSPPFPLIWFYPNRTMVNSSNLGGFSASPQDVSKGYGLRLRSDQRDPDRFGVYSCRLNLTANQTTLPVRALEVLTRINKTVVYEAKPDVHIEGDGLSKTVITGDSLALKCTIQGHEEGKDHVIWTKRDRDSGITTTLLNVPWRNLPVCGAGSNSDARCTPGNDRWTFSRDWAMENRSRNADKPDGHPRDVVTSVLYIDVLEDGDDGYYTCQAENDIGVSSNEVLVRMRDRLAPLWPALGIIAEILLVALFILVCGRRRSKLIEDDEEVEPLKQDTRVSSA